MNNELFPTEAVTMDSPRLAWMKRHGIQVWHTPIDGLCECPETGEEIKAWSCCTLQELDRLSIRAVGTGDTEEAACVEWARKHHEPLWNQDTPAAPSNANVQRRSGDEPASPSVLKPTDQHPAPERSL